MSQPVRKASAPRLAPPRRNSRRVGSGISLAASLISSFGSTPGGYLRMRDMALSQRPVIMARRLRGMTIAMNTWIATKPTMNAMAKKCT